MFETRFISWGISRWLLFFMGIFPLLFVLGFHTVSPELVVVGLLVAVLWVFFISRGFYRFIQIYFWAMMCGLTLEMILALREKNFILMLIGIICVLTFLLFFQWLEKQTRRAQHHPNIRWFEGLPQFFSSCSG
jgi:hypothetical protein